MDNNVDMNHLLTLENREHLTLTGISDVDSFNEEEIILHTQDQGVLVVKGGGLHINKLNVDSGDVNITGEINSMEYLAVSLKSKGSGFFGKMFK